VNDRYVFDVVERAVAISLQARREEARSQRSGSDSAGGRSLRPVVPRMLNKQAAGELGNRREEVTVHRTRVMVEDAGRLTDRTRPVGRQSGFDLAEHLMAERVAIPIIFITAHDDAETRERIARSGPAGYLVKPFDGQALLDVIGKVVGSA